MFGAKGGGNRPVNPTHRRARSTSRAKWMSQHSVPQHTPNPARHRLRPNRTQHVCSVLPGHTPSSAPPGGILRLQILLSKAVPRAGVMSVCREKGVPPSPSPGEGAPRCQGRLKGAGTGRSTHPFPDQGQLHLAMLQSRCLSVEHNMTAYSPGCSSSIALLKTHRPLCHRGHVPGGGTHRPLQPAVLALHPQQLLAVDFTPKPRLLLKVYRRLLLFK